MELIWRPSVINAPSGGASEKAPRWDLVDTESYDGGIRVFAPYVIVWGYVGIYRRKKYVRGATRGPRGWRERPPTSWLRRFFPDVHSKSIRLLSFQK